MADQFYDDIPALTNTIANDIDQIEKTLGFIKDKLQNLFPDWSNTVADQGRYPLLLEDQYTNFKIIKFSIDDGTNANTIKITPVDVYGAATEVAALGTVDNLGSGDTSGGWENNNDFLLILDWDSLNTVDMIACWEGNQFIDPDAKAKIIVSASVNNLYMFLINTDTGTADGSITFNDLVDSYYGASLYVYIIDKDE